MTPLYTHLGAWELDGLLHVIVFTVGKVLVVEIRYLAKWNTGTKACTSFFRSQQSKGYFYWVKPHEHDMTSILEPECLTCWATCATYLIVAEQILCHALPNPGPISGAVDWFICRGFLLSFRAKDDNLIPCQDNTTFAKQVPAAFIWRPR